MILINKAYQNLNKKQQEAVENLNGPVLIVAGAGSGKTRTLTSRLAAILASGVNSKSIIAITFTNKAAEEMRLRVANLLANQSVIPPFIGTFHSLGVRILKAEAHLAGRSKNFTIFDGDDSLKIIKNIIKNFNLDKKRSEINHYSLRKEFSRIKSNLINIEGESDDLIKMLFKEYEASLEKYNAFDFDDLIEKPVKLFLNNPDILKKYQDKFQYVLVDEFQDTNTSQYVFIKLLAKKHNNLSVVGDDAQSIYKFRGSDFKIFLNFENDWPKTKVILLEQNYRSSGNIIKAASGLIANNKFQKLKNLWTENDEGELVKVIEHKDEDEEAGWIAGQIQNSKFKNQNYNLAILYRTNAQSRAIETALIEYGIPYKIFGGIKFYERKEIKDIVAALRWGFNQSDLLSLERLKGNFLKKPFLKLKENMPQKAQELNSVSLISYILETTDYFNHLKKNYDNFQERIENINELIYFAGNFEDLGDFIEEISLLQSGDKIKNKNKLEDNPLALGQRLEINLMTIHLAKGLEFDAVFIIGCNEGLLPHQMSYHNQEEIEEERRLMYVAMTRARKELYLNFYNIPSRFLYELPPELVEFKGEKSIDDEERYIEL